VGFEVGVAAFEVAVPAEEIPVGVLLDGSMEDIDPVMRTVFELERAIEEVIESEREFGPPLTAVAEGFVAVEVTGATEIFCANPKIELANFLSSVVKGILTNSVLIDVKHSVDILQKSITQKPGTCNHYMSENVARTNSIDHRSDPVFRRNCVGRAPKCEC